DLGESRGGGPADALTGTRHQGDLTHKEHGRQLLGRRLTARGPTRAISRSTADRRSATLGAALSRGKAASQYWANRGPMRRACWPTVPRRQEGGGGLAGAIAEVWGVPARGAASAEGGWLSWDRRMRAGPPPRAYLWRLPQQSWRSLARPRL